MQCFEKLIFMITLTQASNHISAQIIQVDLSVHKSSAITEEKEGIPRNKELPFLFAVTASLELITDSIECWEPLEISGLAGFTSRR